MCSKPTVVTYQIIVGPEVSVYILWVQGSDPFYIVSYYIKLITTSWTYSSSGLSSEILNPKAVKQGVCPWSCYNIKIIPTQCEAGVNQHYKSQKNKNKKSIGAKQLTNKEIDNQTNSNKLSYTNDFLGKKYYRNLLCHTISGGISLKLFWIKGQKPRKRVYLASKKKCHWRRVTSNSLDFFRLSLHEEFFVKTKKNSSCYWAKTYMFYFESFLWKTLLLSYLPK